MTDPGAVLGWILAVIGMALIVEPVVANIVISIINRPVR